MKIRHITYLLFIILLLDSCSNLKKDGTSSKNQKAVSPKEYVSWMNNPINGMCKIVEKEALTYVCQYRDYDYIQSIENKGKLVSDSIRKQRFEELKGMTYFELTIKLTNGTGELLKHNLSAKGDYSSRVQYFAFDMQRDLQIRYGDAEMQPCVLYHFERIYDIAPYAKFLLGFESPVAGTNQNIVVEYNDRIFNNGLIKFTFNENDFNRIPKLQTN